MCISESQGRRTDHEKENKWTIQSGVGALGEKKARTQSAYITQWYQINTTCPSPFEFVGCAV